MSVRAVAWEVDGEGGGNVGVRRESAGSVVVKWFCGDERRWRKEALPEAIAYVDRMKTHEDVWLTLTDSDNLRLAVRVEDGKLHADNHPSEGARSVAWEDLKRALKRAME